MNSWQLLFCKQFAKRAGFYKKYIKGGFPFVGNLTCCWDEFSSVQFSCSVMSNSLRPHGLHHARPPCPSPTPEFTQLMSIKSVMPSSHLILWGPLLLLPPIPPSIRVFSNESTLRMRWPKDWSFSFSRVFKNTPYHNYSITLDKFPSPALVTGTWAPPSIVSCLCCCLKPHPVRLILGKTRLRRQADGVSAALSVSS